MLTEGCLIKLHDAAFAASLAGWCDFFMVFRRTVDMKCS